MGWNKLVMPLLAAATVKRGRMGTKWLVGHDPQSATLEKSRPLPAARPLPRPARLSWGVLLGRAGMPIMTPSATAARHDATGLMQLHSSSFGGIALEELDSLPTYIHCSRTATS